MPTKPTTCPMTRGQVVDQYFMEHRAKLLDIAAFLDRVDRAQPGDEATHAVRIATLIDAVAMLHDGRGNRAARILELMSDPTDEPIESALGMKGAIGVYADDKPCP